MTKLSAKQNIIKTCTLMIEGKIDLIEGCRNLTALRHQIDDSENEVFFLIRSVDSETDHYPIGSIREHCSEKYLAQADKEIDGYLADMKVEIIGACKDVIEFLNTQK